MFKRVAAVLVASAAILGLAAEGASAASPRPTQSIVEIASANGSFGTLLTAVGCADPGVAAALTSGDQYTVFAPTDAAFAAAGLDSSNVCTALPQSTLTSVLLYHVTGGRRSANSVLPPKAGKSRTVSTLLEGQVLKVSKAGVISTTSGGSATIVAPNISATNGVIHVIDSVLLPG
ncbi:MAG: fasciclin domain-containing protein [Actinomycetes bacterium]